MLSVPRLTDAIDATSILPHKLSGERRLTGRCGRRSQVNRTCPGPRAPPLLPLTGGVEAARLAGEPWRLVKADERDRLQVLGAARRSAAWWVVMERALSTPRSVGASSSDGTAQRRDARDGARAGLVGSASPRVGSAAERARRRRRRRDARVGRAAGVPCSASCGQTEKEERSSPPRYDDSPHWTSRSKRVPEEPRRERGACGTRRRAPPRSTESIGVPRARRRSGAAG